MEIILKNCNNIDEGVINVEEKKLNIKYAINGTGKSSIANAIQFKTDDLREKSNKLVGLTPFKFLADKNNIPEVSNVEKFKLTKIFNDKYVNDFTFQQDELLKNSFDVFIRNDEYEKGLQEIELLVKDIKNNLINDKEIESLKNDFGEIINAFGRDAKGIHGSSKMAKALSLGNKVENIPEGLEIFKDYIKSNENYKWIKWQGEGKNFIDITENCPYCIENIAEKKEIIKRVTETYATIDITSMNNIVAVFQRLGDYFSESTKQKIDDFVKNINGYTPDQVAFSKEIKDQIERLKQKFEKAQNIGFYSLKDVDKIQENLKNYHIDIELFNHLNSEKTKEKIAIVNTELEKIEKKVEVLKSAILQQQQLINKLVEDNKNKINFFLKSAGYKYTVDIGGENENRKLNLVYTETATVISDTKNHLSYGEKNALALILFMYDALKTNPDLIILDDPISSFDKNKKYAIINMLFRDVKFLRGKTVLLLTHDIDPLVDMMRIHHKEFDKPFATFLENSKNKLSEKVITQQNIITFFDICGDNIKKSNSILNKLVYIRRLYELTKDKNLGYHLVSNVFHKRQNPSIITQDKNEVMTNEQISEAEKQINEKMEGFKYVDVIKIVTDDKQMIELYQSTPSNYEKLHFFRTIFIDKTLEKESDVITKFINESFHIENNYIFQLNPIEYQLVPQYIIDECDVKIAELENNIKK